MGAKVDTTGIEFLEGDFIGPLGKATKKNGPVKRLDTKAYRAPKPSPNKLKQPQNGLQGISSLRLVRELIVRHYKVALIALFSALVGAFVSVGTK